MRYFQKAILVTVVFFIKHVFSGNEEFSRMSGPDHIVQDYIITPYFDTFTTDSILTCYLHCVNLQESCTSVSFEKSTKNCALTKDVGALPVPAIGWESVILSKEILTTTTAALTTTLIDCPTNFTRYLEKCYFVWNQTQTDWFDAFILCDGLSSELVSIESEDEQNFIGSLISGLDFDSHLWISGQGTGAGSYQWTSSITAVTYTNWADGFPGVYDVDSCMYIDGYNLVWEVESCGGINKFMCEYPQTP